jgi:hypothetical protein
MSALRRDEGSPTGTAVQVPSSLVGGLDVAMKQRAVALSLNRAPA